MKKTTILRRKSPIKKIVKELEDYIISNQLPPDTPLASSRILAERFKVSAMTIKRAFDYLEQKGLIYRKRGSGTFATGFTHTKTGYGYRVALGLYQPVLSNKEGYFEAFEEPQLNLIDMLQEKGIETQVLTRGEKQNPDLLRQALTRCDLIALNKDLVTNDNLPLLLKCNKPVILLNLPCVWELPFSQVVPDYYKGFRNVIDHFESCGCTDIIVASIANTEAHQHRCEEFIKTVKSYSRKLKIVDSLTRQYIPYDMGQKAGQLIGKKYLQLNNRPAIFSVSDFLSFGIISTLQEAGYKAGKSYKLISFDNIESKGLYPFGQPILTSLSNPKDDLYRHTVNLIISELNNYDNNTRIIKVHCNDLIKRKTC